MNEEQAMKRETSNSEAVGKSIAPECLEPSASRAPLGELARAATNEMRPTTAIKPANGAPPSSEDIYLLIQESAYYKAEARGFSPGYEEQDWLAAEAEIKVHLGVGTERKI
jgi:hypothetical protein